MMYGISNQLCYRLSCLSSHVVSVQVYNCEP